MQKHELKQIIREEISKAMDSGSLRLYKGLNKKGDFTGLVKIKNFTTVDDCLKILNKEFANAQPDDEDYDESDSLYTSVKYPGKGYTYCQVAGDGEVDFVKSLKDYSKGYNTEKEWGVARFEEMK